MTIIANHYRFVMQNVIIRYNAKKLKWNPVAKATQQMEYYQPNWRQKNTTQRSKANPSEQEQLSSNSYETDNM